MSAAKRAEERTPPAPPRRSFLPLLWLALPTLVLLPLVWISTFWHVSTRVQLELVTTRLAFSLGGEERREILNRSVPFSSLVIEDCKSAAFAAETLEVADPRQLVPGAGPGEAPSFPAAAWRKLEATVPVRLSCSDPAAKLTLRSPEPGAPRLGLLDRIRFEPGSEIVLEVSPGKPPALSLEMETPQDLTLALGHDLEIVADLAEPEGIALPFSGDLLTYRARLPAARRTLEVASGGSGLVLILTPPKDQLAEIFPEQLDLPLASVELLAEQLEGPFTSPLREKATLRYPDYPGVPPVTLEKGETLSLRDLSKARLAALDLDAEKGALRARFDGIAERVTSHSGEFASDHRLTLFHTFRYSWRWGLIAAAAAWLFSTSWAAYGMLKKLRE